MFWYPLLAVLIWSGNAIVSKLAAGQVYTYVDHGVSGSEQKEDISGI